MYLSTHSLSITFPPSLPQYTLFSSPSTFPFPRSLIPISLSPHPCIFLSPYHHLSLFLISAHIILYSSFYSSPIHLFLYPWFHKLKFTLQSSPHLSPFPFFFFTPLPLLHPSFSPPDLSLLSFSLPTSLVPPFFPALLPSPFPLTLSLYILLLLYTCIYTYLLNFCIHPPSSFSLHSLSPFHRPCFHLCRMRAYFWNISFLRTCGFLVT